MDTLLEVILTISILYLSLIKKKSIVRWHGAFNPDEDTNGFPFIHVVLKLIGQLPQWKKSEQIILMHINNDLQVQYPLVI